MFTSQLPNIHLWFLHFFLCLLYFNKLIFKKIKNNMKNTVKFWASKAADKMGIEVETAACLEL